MAKNEDKRKNEDIKKEEELETIEAEIVDDGKKEEARDVINDVEGMENVNEEIEKYKDQLQRLQAEFSNYKKRTNKEKEDTIKYASESLITKLLPVLDNMDRASNNMEELKEEDNEQIKAFIEGFELIKNDFVNILKDEGLSSIESDGKEFDLNYHHAVLMEESEGVESNHVIETFQKGYILNGKVIRPAMVKVSK